MPGLRTRGYREAHEAAGTAVVDELIVSCGFGVDDGCAADAGSGRSGGPVRRDLRPDRLGGDRGAACTGRGRSAVPEDVQVVGFDNLADGRFTVPALTTVEPGNDEMADAICALLMERIESRPAPVPARVVMPEAADRGAGVDPQALTRASKVSNSPLPLIGLPRGDLTLYLVRHVGNDSDRMCSVSRNFRTRRPH